MFNFRSQVYGAAATASFKMYSQELMHSSTICVMFEEDEGHSGCGQATANVTNFWFWCSSAFIFFANEWNEWVSFSTIALSGDPDDHSKELCSEWLAASLFSRKVDQNYVIGKSLHTISETLSVITSTVSSIACIVGALLLKASIRQ